MAHLTPRFDLVRTPQGARSGIGTASGKNARDESGQGPSPNPERGIGAPASAGRPESDTLPVSCASLAVSGLRSRALRRGCSESAQRSSSAAYSSSVPVPGDRELRRGQGHARRPLPLPVQRAPAAVCRHRGGPAGQRVGGHLHSRRAARLGAHPHQRQPGLLRVELGAVLVPLAPARLVGVGAAGRLRLGRHVRRRRQRRRCGRWPTTCSPRARPSGCSASSAAVRSPATSSAASSCSTPRRSSAPRAHCIGMAVALLLCACSCDRLWRLRHLAQSADPGEEEVREAASRGPAGLRAERAADRARRPT